MKSIKTKYGYSVDCYGDIDETSTILMAFDDEGLDGPTASCFHSWESAVRELAAYAERNETRLIELESD